MRSQHGINRAGRDDSLYTDPEACSGNVADFELHEVDITDPGSDELLPIKGYVHILCKSTTQSREYPTGDGTAWVSAFERDLVAGRFGNYPAVPA